MGQSEEELERGDGPDPDHLAARCAERMWSWDRASRSLGMVIEDVRAGAARLSMTVRADMANGHDFCHGGLIATLADSAFGYACNSRGPMTVAAGFTIDFLEPARIGDHLVAEAREVALRGRSGIYDVTVRRDDEVIAQFRGRSRSLDQPILEDPH